MNKEQLQKQIADMELKLQEMKEELNKPKEFEFKYLYGQSYLVGSFDVIGKCAGTERKALHNGRYRIKRENAELALQRNKEANLIEALAEQLEPNWVADWENVSQNKYYIYYEHNDKQYVCDFRWSSENIGQVYMSKETAETICKILNNGEFIL